MSTLPTPSVVQSVQKFRVCGGVATRQISPFYNPENRRLDVSWCAAYMVQDLISTAMTLLRDEYMCAVLGFLVSLQDGWIWGYNILFHLIVFFGRVPIFRFSAFK
jgi:hypothetical protein